MMKQIADQHAIINGHRIAYGIHGNEEEGTGEAPVVLLHGTPSSSYIWRNITPALTGAKYRVYVFDLLGYGLSERPYDAAVDTSVTGQTLIFEEMLKFWQLTDFHLIAHDIGGGIAQRFGVQSPHRLRSLTMIDVVSFDSWPSKRTIEQMAAGLDTLIKAPDGVHRAHFRAWLQSTVHNKDRFADTAEGVFLDFITGPVGQASLFQHQVRHYDGKHTAEVAPDYAKLGTNPVQLIWGADDAWQVVDWAYRLADAIPNAEIHILDDCGHFAMEDQPEAIATLLVDFLARHSSKQG